MDLEELLGILRTKPEFKDIGSWTFDRITLGSVGKQSHVISSGMKRYFIKDIKNNEANALCLITPLGLKHFISVRYPDLLEKNVMVADYVSGRPLRSKILHPGLIRDFAIMQNTLNRKDYFDRNRSNKYSKCKYSDCDDGFFRRGHMQGFRIALSNMRRLRKRYLLPIAQRFLYLAESLYENRQDIIGRFVKMPFAWQHHDFREDNIIGSYQVLVDWGSSYGYGPFMYDLAPFLLGNPRSLKTYMKHSEICRQASKDDVRQWLYVSAATRIMERLRYHFEDLSEITEAKAKEFLDYEYKTYKQLLKKPRL